MRIALVVVAAVAVAVSGCAGLTKLVPASFVLDSFNGPAKRPPVPNFTPCSAEVEGALKDTLADVYETSGALAQVTPAAAPALADATACVRDRLRQSTGDRPCFAALFTALAFPSPPSLTAPMTQAQWDAERDVHRVQNNLQRAVRAVASACLVREGAGFPANAAAERQALVTAYDAGVRALAAYQAARPRTVRNGKPVSAWVLAGGAANGAFSAGAAWWLLKSREQCGAACAGYALDMVGGASTGTLIAAVTKRYFSPLSSQADRARMLDVLVDRYTCSTNAELYCAQPLSLYDVLFAEQASQRGLVKFDGIRELMAANVGSLPVITGAPEQFASTVDFESGRVFHVSSVEQTVEREWHEALEASIVEPLMAEPVPSVKGRAGTWIDGGLRSGLPLSTVLRRGAERAVMFVNTAIESVPRPRQDNAAQIGFRALDLFSLQPIVGELAFAEHERVLRSAGEKERCLSRYNFDGAGATALTVERRCSGLPPIPDVTFPYFFSPVTQPGTPSLERVPDTYRSSWLFMPSEVPAHYQQVARLPDEAPSNVQWDELGAVGYTFNPREMWRLFALGAVTAQQRCEDVAKTLGWDAVVPGCTDATRVIQALTQLRTEFVGKQCTAKPLTQRKCP